MLLILIGQVGKPRSIIIMWHEPPLTLTHSGYRKNRVYLGILDVT